MRILLSNDDGVHAPGINVLAEQLCNVGHQVMMIAPDRDRSGASNSLTLDRPLHPILLDKNKVSVNGTPTDCVHLGLQSLCEVEPDIVLSGINSGANLGDDVLYSGTVAAATEGRFLERNPIAVSLNGITYFECAARFMVEWLPKLVELRFPKGIVINVNIPDVPFDALEGIEVTRLGHRERSDNPVEMTNPRGKRCYWISGSGQGKDAGLGTDFFAVENNKVSITPIQVDMTAYSANSKLQMMLAGADKN